jgi:hypothetical protein
MSLKTLKDSMLRFMFGIPRVKKIQHRWQTNVLIVEEGYREDDSFGMTDYSISLKVKRGKVYKKVLRKPSCRERVNHFTTYRLTPKTKSAVIVVSKIDTPYLARVSWRCSQTKEYWVVRLEKPNKGKRTRTRKIRRFP